MSKTRRLLATAGLAAAVAGVLPGAAAADTLTATECEYGSTSQIFAQFGDLNQYFLLAPGGDFESLDGWKAKGTRLVSNENPFALAGGTKSLHLGEEDDATSPRFCVSRDLPHLRFVAEASGGDPLDVTVRHHRADGRRVTSSVTTRLSSGEHRSWAPTRNIDLRTSGFEAGQSTMATVSFATDDDDWTVDDVYIDPYRR